MWLLIWPVEADFTRPVDGIMVVLVVAVVAVVVVVVVVVMVVLVVRLWWLTQRKVGGGDGEETGEVGGWLRGNLTTLRVSIKVNDRLQLARQAALFISTHKKGPALTGATFTQS